VSDSASAVAREDAGPWRRALRRLLQGASLALVAGLLVLLVWRVADAGRGSHLVSEIRLDRKPPAPQFLLPVLWDRRDTWPARLRSALDDGHVSPDELRGSPVVLNFWASWCVPCRKEAPVLAAAARAHAGRVTFLGVDVQDFKSDARGFLRRYKVEYVSVRDGGDSTYTAYGLTGLPETYWLDERGRIVAHYPGQISREQLELGISEAQKASR
jgi:cytochrome c biogenesis protein CcmG, thiol:disulfide interchange protein DsbE